MTRQSKYPHVIKAAKYSRDILSGKIPACKWVKLACQRQLDDLKRWKSKTKSPYWFDREAAEKRCNFFEMLPHVRGKKFAGTLLVLEPWQCFIETTVWGWKESDGSRRFTESVELVPRKQGKSFRKAAGALYALGPENQPGAECFCGAMSQDQAWTVFRPAKAIAEKLDEYKEFYNIQVNASNIANLDNGSFFRPIIGKPGDGDGAFLYICDEFHEAETPDQYDAMRQGFFDKNAMADIISTAGSNIEGPCHAKQKEIEDILEGKVKNEKLFGINYTKDPDDDWSTVETLKKCNPNYGVSVDIEIVEQERLQAIRYSRYQNAYKTKRLNMWVGAKEAWMNMEAWSKCADSTLNIDDFIGEGYCDGLDLASKNDIASRAKVFKRMVDGEAHFYLFTNHFVPEEATRGEDKADYAGWVHDGHMIATPGNMIDYEFIEEDIVSSAKGYDLKEIAYDPNDATYLVTRLAKISDFDEKLIEFRAIVLNFSEPMKELEALVLDGRFHHDDNPVMNWMMGNVVALEDAKRNIYPRKEKKHSKKKIDGAVAAIMSYARMRMDPEGKKSRYEDEDAEVYTY